MLRRRSSRGRGEPLLWQRSGLVPFDDVDQTNTIAGMTIGSPATIFGPGADLRATMRRMRLGIQAQLVTTVGGTNTSHVIAYGLYVGDFNAPTADPALSSAGDQQVDWVDLWWDTVTVGGAVPSAALTWGSFNPTNANNVRDVRAMRKIDESQALILSASIHSVNSGAALPTTFVLRQRVSWSGLWSRTLR